MCVRHYYDIWRTTFRWSHHRPACCSCNAGCILHILACCIYHDQDWFYWQEVQLRRKMSCFGMAMHLEVKYRWVEELLSVMSTPSAQIKISSALLYGMVSHVDQKIHRIISLVLGSVFVRYSFNAENKDLIKQVQGFIGANTSVGSLVQGFHNWEQHSCGRVGGKRQTVAPQREAIPFPPTFPGSLINEYFHCRYVKERMTLLKCMKVWTVVLMPSRFSQLWAKFTDHGPLLIGRWES